MSARYLGGVIAQTQLPLNPAAGNAANGVFTLEQYMQAVKNATWPGFDPYFNETVLLLHGNGTNGAQNNTFLDSSTNNFTITRNGNTTQGTFSPFSLAAGQWSNYFDGSGDYLSISDSTAFNMGSGDFTVECWIYTTNASATSTFITTAETTDFQGFFLGMYGGSFTFLADNNGLTPWAVDIYGGTVVANTWIHVAGVRNGNVFTLYVNGVSVGSSTQSITLGNSNNRVVVGGRTASGGQYLTGYLSNARVVKGTAVYTSAFTPSTTPLTAITNTSLLTCQSNRFVDNSTNAFAITSNGDVRVTPFSPFAPTAAYSAGTNGGSGYFDGTGDYLSIADNAAFQYGSGDFTIEAWVYRTASANQQIIGSHEEGTAASWLLAILSNNKVRLLVNNSTSLDSSGTVPLNTWSHIVAIRNGNNLFLYINGVAEGSLAFSTSINSNPYPITIGADQNGDEVAYSGYIGSLRIVKGQALTTGAFTPPTAPVTTSAVGWTGANVAASITGTVSLLCNFTNAGIIDNTGKNNLETVGNAQIDTAVKKFGDGSLEFDGSGDYLLAPADQRNIEFLTGDFTIECWIRFAVVGNSQIVTGLTAANTIYWQYFSSQLAFGQNNVANIAATNWSPVVNTWYHIAVTRSGTTVRQFVDGVQLGSNATSSASFPNGPIQIGSGGGGSLNGYIDDLRITKGVARYTSNFAVPYLPQGPLPLVGGPYIPNTVLMLPGTGTNGAQNNTFLDSSTNNFTITRNGNTTQGTFTPFSRANGYWGNYFDGTGDFLTTPSNSAFDFGTGDFTVEFWAYVQTTSGFTALVGTRTGDTSSTIRWSMYIESSSSSLTTEIYNTSNTSMGFIIFQSTFPRNQWVHCALVRSGTSFRLYQNGVQSSSSITSSTAVANSSTVVRVGDFDSSVVADLNGYISNLRIVKGTAVYTSNFTPTGPLTAIANTSLLTCQSNRFIDNSTNNFTITRNGDVKVVTFSPFEYLTAYSAATNGGSGYFDGTGDYLSVASATALNLATGAFTIEAWVYLVGGTFAYVASRRTAAQARGFVFYYDYSTKKFVLLAGDTNTASWEVNITSTNSYDIGQWVHVAITRNSSNDFTLWVNGTSQATANSSVTIADDAGTLLIGAVDSGTNSHSGYFSSWRLVKDAVYTTAFTPPTAPLTAITNTSLLLNFTNAGIYDASMTNDLETVGNAQVSTTQSKWGGGSMYFDGSGDYLVAPSVTELTLNADFTIEGWAYLNASGNYRLLTLGDAIGTSGIEIYVSSGNWVVYSNNATRITGSAATRQVWTHIAVVRSGSTVALYINGAASGSTWSSSASFSGRLFVGAEFYNSGITADTNGFISDLRILNGVAILPTPLQTSQWQDQ